MNAFWAVVLRTPFGHTYPHIASIWACLSIHVGIFIDIPDRV